MSIPRPIKLSNVMLVDTPEERPQTTLAAREFLQVAVEIYRWEEERSSEDEQRVAESESR